MSLLRALGAIASSGAGAPTPPVGPQSWVLMEPTSVSHTGTSASIGANGEVTFSAVESLYVNGVFTSQFANYVMILKAAQSGLQTGLSLRFTASGVANSDASSYTGQRITGASSTLAGAALSDSSAAFSRLGSSNTSTFTNIFGPYLNQHTSLLNIDHSGNATITEPYLYQYAGVHTVTNQYDGVQLITDPDMTGTVKFYGVGGEL